MTDITELAQREKFESWWERTQHNGNPPRFGWAQWREGDGYKVDDDESELDGMWEAWKAAGAELVEALEKAQQRNGELETYSKTALEFREAARDENRHLKLELEIAEKRIAELEEAERKLCAANVTLDARADRAERQMAELESRTVTVKLPRLYGIDFDNIVPDSRNGFLFYSEQVMDALTAAGIKVEAE